MKSMEGNRKSVILEYIKSTMIAMVRIQLFMISLSVREFPIHRYTVILFR